MVPLAGPSEMQAALICLAHRMSHQRLHLPDRFRQGITCRWFSSAMAQKSASISVVQMPFRHSTCTTASLSLLMWILPDHQLIHEGICAGLLHVPQQSGLGEQGATLRLDSVLMALNAPGVSISWQYSITSSSRGLATVVSRLATLFLRTDPFQPCESTSIPISICTELHLTKHITRCGTSQSVMLSGRETCGEQVAHPVKSCALVIGPRWLYFSLRPRPSSPPRNLSDLTAAARGLTHCSTLDSRISCHS